MDGMDDMDGLAPPAPLGLGAASSADARRMIASRRGFLRAGTALGLGAFLGGRAGGEEADAGIRTIDNTPAQESGEPPEMTIARWTRGLRLPEHDMKTAAQQLTEQAIAQLGGMECFVARGDVVWITPNIGFRYGPAYAVNTNPDVVATLVRLCLDAGAKRVKVGCNAAYGAEVTYTASGIGPAVEAVDGEMVTFDHNDFVKAPVHGERLHEWPVYREIDEADLVINAPIAKNHGLARVTACMKNHMGMVGEPRYTWHRHLPECLSDITAYLRPRLSVVDAVRVLISNGPEGGELDDVRRVGMVAAGTNTVGLEAFAAELLGLDPAKGLTMAKAMDKGLGHIDFRNNVRTREVILA